MMLAIFVLVLLAAFGWFYRSFAPGIITLVVLALIIGFVKRRAAFKRTPDYIGQAVTAQKLVSQMTPRNGFLEGIERATVIRNVGGRTETFVLKTSQQNNPLLAMDAFKTGQNLAAAMTKNLESTGIKIFAGSSLFGVDIIKDSKIMATVTNLWTSSFSDQIRRRRRYAVRAPDGLRDEIITPFAWARRVTTYYTKGRPAFMLRPSWINYWLFNSNADLKVFKDGKRIGTLRQKRPWFGWSPFYNIPQTAIFLDEGHADDITPVQAIALLSTRVAGTLKSSAY